MKIAPINIIAVACALLVFLFSYTAISKFLEYDKFIFQMKLVPLSLMKDLAPVLGWLVPLVEAIIVFLLLFPRWGKLGLISSIVLLGIFELYIGGMLLSGLELGCTCGGVISQMGWKTHLFFNAAFMLIAWVGLRAMAGKWPVRNRI